MVKPVSDALNEIVTARVPADEVAYAHADAMLGVAVPAVRLAVNAISAGEDTCGVGGFLSDYMQRYATKPEARLINRLDAVSHALDGLVRIGNGDFKSEGDRKKISLGAAIGYGSFSGWLSAAEAENVTRAVQPYMPLLLAAHKGVNGPLQAASRGELNLELCSLSEAASFRASAAEQRIMDVYGVGGAAAGGELVVAINGKVVSSGYYFPASDEVRPPPSGSRLK